MKPIKQFIRERLPSDIQAFLTVKPKWWQVKFEKNGKVHYTPTYNTLKINGSIWYNASEIDVQVKKAIGVVNG
jgi:hypothetical protein